eukprot:7630571-Pyramimonas_sp.AAC.1
MANASEIHRRCIGDAGGTSATLARGKSGSTSLPHRRCTGDAARSSDPIYSDPIWEACRHRWEPRIYTPRYLLGPVPRGFATKTWDNV